MSEAKPRTGDQATALEPERVPGGEAAHGARVSVFLVVLTALALATRLVWVLWIHPPGDYVFSDMHKYVERAQHLAENGFRSGIRPLAWQAWGTHTILAIPLAIFGKDNLTAAAVVWGVQGALAVPVGYLLATRVCRHPIVAKLVGVTLLVWHPSLSNTGYFLSETPFLLFQLWSTYWLVVLIQDGRRALGAGLVSAVAFAVRPQSALFYLLVLLTWMIARNQLTRVRSRHLVAVAAPLLAMLLVSFWRFHACTGYWGGVAENANMNLTAGRCHNIVTQAFRTKKAMRRSERRNNRRDGRRVSLPGYRALAKRFPPQHPLALRPALESDTLRFVGYIGDPEVNRRVRSECYRRTGVLEQIRYSFVNASLSWFVGGQWPELERGRAVFYGYVEFFKYVFQIVFWLPSLLGMIYGIVKLRDRPGLALCAWQLVTSIVVASIFFGTIRLRTPYDPYAVVLAFEMGVVVWAWTRARLAKRSRVS